MTHTPLNEFEARGQEQTVEQHELTRLHAALGEAERSVHRLRASEQRYRTFVHLAAEGIWRQEIMPPMPTGGSEDEQIAYLWRHAVLAECNPAFAQMCGYERLEDVPGMNLDMLGCHPTPLNMTTMRGFIRNGYSVTDGELRIVDRAGHTRHALASMVGVIEDGRLVRVWGIQRDRLHAVQGTSAPGTDERFQALFEQARQSAVLSERTRLAREIHDTLAQGLAGIIVQLQAARDMHTADPDDQRAHLDEAIRLAKGSLAEARRSVRALRPAALVDTDVGGALAHLARHLTATSNLVVSYSVVGASAPISPAVESQLLRITQEAVTNIVRHAQARQVQIELRFEAAEARLRVQDDGQGFDPQRRNHEQFGIVGMQERAREIGGAFAITSDAGQGTTIMVRVPLLTRHQQETV